VTFYFDTSALVKLMVVERETAALRALLAERSDERRAASALVRTELRRTARRLPGDLLPVAERLLAGLALVPTDEALLDTAGTLGPAVLRSLDAIHLAAALRVAPIAAVITYDERMAAAATSLGLTVMAPGV
jgi:predicted nucleic acid-binding protein